MLATRSGAAETGLRALISGLALSAVLAGCSAGSGNPPAAIPADAPTGGEAATGPTQTPSSSPTADPTSSPTTALPPADPTPDPTPTADPSESPTSSARPPAPSGPAPARMEPPTLVSATEQGCLRLPGGGREATFTVAFSGGARWTLLPEDGPAAPTGSGAWRVVIDTTNSAASISLRHLKVGGGTPFSTAVLTLPTGMVATADC